MHNLRHLRYVVETAKHGSITKASRVLLVSQPAISAAVRACEEEFDIRLFIRRPSQGLSLTSSGRMFVKHATELLERAEDMRQLFTEHDEGSLSGHLELACYASPAPLLVPPVISAFAKKHPGVTVGIREGNMEQVVSYLKQGTADIALTYDIFLDSGIEFEVIARLAPFAVVSARNPLAKKTQLSLAELVEKPLILLDSPGFREFFYNYMGNHGLRPRVEHRPTTYEMVRGMLADGKSYSLALVKIKNAHAYDGTRLVNVELVEAPPQVNLVIAYVKGHALGRLAKAFAEHCKTLLHRVETGAAATKPSQ